jgi:hypothetical protein
MTNYCTNLIEVEGSEIDMAAFRAACFNKSGGLDFAAILPCPRCCMGPISVPERRWDGTQSLAHLRSMARRLNSRFTTIRQYSNVGQSKKPVFGRLSSSRIG